MSRISASVATPGIIGTPAGIVAFVARLLYRLGRLVAAHPVIVLLIWIAAAAGVTLVVKQVGSETSNNVDLPGTGSQLATDLLQAGFPPQQNGSNPIIFKVTKGKVTDSANKQAITDSYKAIKKIGFVHSATSPFSQDGQGQVSKDGKIAFISVLLSISSNELTEEEAQRVMNAAEPGVKAGMQVEGGGSIGSTLSPNDTSTSDLIGILAAMLILTLTFGTVVAMGMPIGGAVIGLTTALGLIGLMGHLIAVPDIAHTVATMIGLAVGIDYALFLVTRHRSQLRRGHRAARVDRPGGRHGGHGDRVRRLHRGRRAGVAGRGRHPARFLAGLHRCGGRGHRRAGRDHPAARLHVAGRHADQLDRAAEAVPGVGRPGAQGHLGPLGRLRRPPPGRAAAAGRG